MDVSLKGLTFGAAWYSLIHTAVELTKSGTFCMMSFSMILICSLHSGGIACLRANRKNAQKVLSSFCSTPQRMAIARIFCLVANITIFKTQVIVGEVSENMHCLHQKKNAC